MSKQSVMEPSFDAIFEFTTHGMALITLEGQWLRINSKLGCMLGYTEQELLATSVNNQIPITYLHQMEITFDRLISRESKSVQLTIDLKHKNSLWIHVNLLMCLMRNSEDEPHLYMAQIEEISLQSEMERKLAESKKRYKSLIEHNPAGILTCDQQGKVLSVNPAMERILNLKEEQLQGQFIHHLFLHDDLMNGTSDLILAMQDNYMLRFNHCCEDVIDLGVKNVPIIVNDNWEGTYLIAKDITQFIRDRESLRIAQQDLHDTVRKQQGMTMKFREINGILIHTLCDGELLYRLGFKPSDILGKGLYEIWPSHVAAWIENFYQRAWNGEENVMYEASLQDITHLVSLRPIIENGRVIEVIGSCVDITERKRMELELLEKEELLRKSDKLSVAGQLAAGLAHEIRNPLTSLRGFLQLLKHDLKGKQHYFDIMLSELDRINFIVSEFLVIAKPEAITHKKNNLVTILQSVVALLDTQAALCDVQLLLEFQSEIPEIICSEMHLKQLFINLVKNAIEAIPKDGQIKMTVSLQGNDLIRVRTQDNGCGIPEERLKQLGEPFYTTKEKGTGLGLMMCFKIVEAHKGAMNVQSQVGFGTTIDVLLPTLWNETNQLT